MRNTDKLITDKDIFQYRKNIPQEVRNELLLSYLICQIGIIIILLNFNCIRDTFVYIC